MEQNSGINVPALAKAQEVMSKFTSLASAPNVFRVSDRLGTDRSQFPVQLGSTDPQDSRYLLQKQLVNNNQQGVIPGVGQVIVGPDYFDYAKRKQDQATLLDFQKFVMEQANLNTPEAAAWWFEHFPWMKDLRWQEIEKQAEVQKALAKINLTGPQSEEDFMLLYLLNQGLIKIANRPLHQMYQDNALISTTYQAGLFSPIAAKTRGGANDLHLGIFPPTVDYPARVNYGQPIPARNANGVYAFDRNADIQGNLPASPANINALLGPAPAP